MRMARLIVHGHPALAAVANHPFDRLDRPIEEIHLPACDGKPAAADDPRSPAADLGDPCGAWIVDQTLRGLEEAPDIQPRALVEVEADVIIRGRVRRAARARAAERDSDHAGDLGENGNDSFKKGVGGFHAPKNN